MNLHKIRQVQRLSVKRPLLIEGLPGIGNVGKVAVDFLIENLNAKKIFDISSDRFPHAVFVNEHNLVELPSIEIYHARVKKQDLLLLAGDIQPSDEMACYDFCHRILDLVEKYGGTEVITLGGIGLQQVPQDPKVYCTGNTKKIIQKYKSPNLHPNVYGVVGPIIGVSGLLVGLSKQRNIPSIALLAETFGHPNYLGIKGAREILKILNEKLTLDLNLSQLDEEIKEVEQEVRTKADQFSKLQKDKRKFPDSDASSMDYIG